MELQRFGKLLLELSELSVDEKSIIFIQLAKDFGFCVEAKKDESAASESAEKRTPRPHYTPQERTRLRFYATNWQSLTEAKQQAALSSFDNRTESQVYRMIHKYRTGK